MDLDISDDQEVFRATSQRFIKDTLPLPSVRKIVDETSEVDRGYLLKAAELGWFAMVVPEESGGGTISGHGVCDAAIVAEERGRALQPGPFVEMNVVASTIAIAGLHEAESKVLPELLAANQLATWAVNGPVGMFDPAAGVDVAWSGDTGHLRGRKILVQDAPAASWILVAARHRDGVSQFLVPTDVPGVRILRRGAFDQTRGLSDLVFDDVEIHRGMVVGQVGEAAAAINRQLDLACVLSCAESVGSMDVLFWETVEYAKSRTAFGRPIGSFQAVKHLLADTAVMLEQSKAISTAAARKLDLQEQDASEVVSAAKAFVSEAGVALAHNCWQVYGGIAFTWEHDFHLFLRRLTLNASLYGEATYHYERICRLNKLGEE